MGERTSEYWQERFRQMEESQHDTSIQTVQKIEQEFWRAERALDGKINAWYQRFAANNGISMAEARRLLNSDELEEFRWDVQDYIKYGRENGINQQWAKQLENASAKVHISRLEALKVQTQQEIEKLYGNYHDSIDEHIANLYTSGYYHTAYEVQRGIGVGWQMQSFNPEKVNDIIHKPWAVDGRNFSERIWTDKTKLINNMHDSLTRMCITGESPDRAIREISQNMKVSRSQAARIVQTESAAFSAKAQETCFSDLGVEEFEVVETLDSHTCPTCGEMDGKHFSMKDYKIGVTVPPFHPNCRGCTCPYFNDEFTTDGYRVGRNVQTGEKNYFPANMTYKEWYNRYISSSSDAQLAIKKAQNLNVDREQYKEYKDRLGKEYLPTGISEFQNIKYGDLNEYGILKAQYKGMTYYEKAVRNEPLITNSVKYVANRVKMEAYGLEYRLKSKDSYLRKIRTEYKPNGNAYEVKDIIRYTLGTENSDALVERMNAAIAELTEMGYNTIKLKNTWNSMENPYRGINTTVVASNGQKFEIQYHTKESFELKNGKMHELYEKARLIDDTESEEYIELKNKMFDLSDTLTAPKGVEKVKSYGK